MFLPALLLQKNLCLFWLGACCTLRRFGQGKTAMILDWTPSTKHMKSSIFSPFLVNLSWLGCSHFIFIPTCELILFFPFMINVVIIFMWCNVTSYAQVEQIAANQVQFEKLGDMILLLPHPCRLHWPARMPRWGATVTFVQLQLSPGKEM